MSINSASANAYKEQQILTAPPEKLILMLYNGCLKFMNDTISAIQSKDIQNAHNYCIRAQDIVSELMSTLNMDFAISKELMTLYEYVNYQLVQANLQKNAQCVIDAKDIIINIRDGWIDAMKTARAEGAAPQQKIVGDSISV